MGKLNTLPTVFIDALSRIMAYTREIAVARLVCAEFVLICFGIVLMSS